MSANDKFTLYVYDGDYGLPSMNVDCVKSLLYTSIAKVPVQIKTLSNIKQCILNKPSFVHKNLCFKSFNETVLYLNTLNYNLDGNLSAKQRSEALAITNLVQSKLKIALEFTLWIDHRNFEEFTRVWFSRALPLPFNIIHTNKFKEKAVDLIESLYPSDCSMEVVKEYINSLTTECLSSLSARLGTSDFFFGESPSTLDVIVYSYIAPLLKLPLPSSSVSGLVVMWPNLVNFVKRIDVKYFPEVPKESKYIKSEETRKTSDDEVSYLAISIITLSAVTLMFGFAVSKGINISKFY